MEDDNKIICQKCGKAMDPGQFYTYKNGEKTEMCKKCLTMHIKPFEPDTFVWLLKKMDVPYLPEEWNTLRNRDFAKDPKKLSGMAIFGKYLSKMKLKQWKDYGWEDSEKLQNERLERLEREKEKDEEQKKFEQEMTEKFEKGEINEAQYKTLVSAEVQYASGLLADSLPPPQQDNPYDENNFISEDELIDPSIDLTKEDKLYLAMKWGRLYKPNEWIELERKYNEMMNSFDIQDSDTIGTLILICKTYLKMNSAIDQGDLESYQKLSRVYDALRKSAKFTAAQNKAVRDQCVDSIGQLVAYCEKNGGQIPKYEIDTDLDIVDKVIKDLKDYTKSLIYEDTALSQQIENYIKKKEISDNMKKDREEAKKKGLEEVEISEEDIQKHYERIEEEKNQDFKMMLGGEDEFS